MTSTAPISQSTAPPGAGPGERGSRSGPTTTEENAFSGLLSKMAGGNQDGVRKQADTDREPPSPGGEHNRRPFMWVAASTDVIEDVMAADAALLADTGSAAGDEVDVPPSRELPIGISPAGAAGSVASAQAGMPMPQPSDGEHPLPGHAARQMLPDGAQEMTPQGPVPVLRETVSITVVKQETHFAPVLANLLTGKSAGYALETAADGRVQRAMVDGRTAPADSTETSPASTKPLILSAVNAGAGSGRATLSAGVGVQRDGMPGFAPMSGMRGEAVAAGAEPTMQTDASAASVRADAPAGGVTTSSAVQLVAERIAREAAAEVARTSQPGQMIFLAQSSPLKVLHIQLQPADLGTVTVRMSLKEKTLQLDLEVSRGETAQLLQRDKEALSSLLRSAGYLIEGMDVRMADAGAAASQTSTGGAQTAPQQWGGQPGSSNMEGRSPGSRPGDGTQGNTFGGERYGTDGQVGEPSRGSGVYV